MSEDELGAWIERNKRSRADFPAGDAGDRAFAEWQGKYAHGLQQIMALPAVVAAGRRFAQKNFQLVVDDDGHVTYSERGVHQE